jgi:endonuclease/exonuclease/phosphatase family metal-dependent hydrolase
MRVSLVALALLPGCGQRPLEPRDPTPGVPNFRVATFNILDEGSSDPANVEAVGLLNADIIALQEVTPAWETVLRARYSSRYPNMLFHASGAAGLGFLTIYPLVDVMFLPAPNGWHPAWHVHVQTPAGQLGLLSVHLVSPNVKGLNVLSALSTAKTDHHAELVDFADKCFLGGPTMVVGDFNEGENGGGVSYLESRGFQDALPLFHPGQGTWQTASLGGQMSQALDHIMFDKSVQPLNTYVLRVGNSDHLPVVAFFEASYTWPTP